MSVISLFPEEDYEAEVKVEPQVMTEEETAQALRDLESRLEQNEGEFVIIIKHGHKRDGCAGFGGKLYWTREHVMQLGAPIKKPFLERTEAGGVKIFVDRYIADFGNYKWHMFERNMFLRSWEFAGLNKELEPKTKQDLLFRSLTDLAPAPTKLQIIIGEEGLREYNQSILEYISSTYIELQNKDPTAFERVYGKRLAEANNNRLNNFMSRYFQGRLALGLECEEAEGHFIDSYKQIYRELDRLIYESFKRMEELRGIRDQKPPRTSTFTEGQYAAIIQEDFRDSQILSAISQKRSLDRFNNDIKQRLRFALAIGMDKSITVLKSLPGVRVHLGEYISGLCNIYGVKREIREVSLL